MAACGASAAMIVKRNDAEKSASLRNNATRFLAVASTQPEVRMQ